MTNDYKFIYNIDNRNNLCFRLLIQKDNNKLSHIKMKKEGGMKIIPLGDKILVEPIEESEVTKSGIVLPDTAKEKPQRGKVIAVGTGRLVDGKRVPLEVKEGDVVVFKKYAPDEIKVDGKEYYILEESDILAKIE